MSDKEYRRYEGMTDRELLMVVIERQTMHKESHDELKMEIKSIRTELQDLKDTRTEQRGAGRLLAIFATILGAVGTVLGIKNGL